jgi:RNA polymerase sigma-70 factor (family 1)
MNHSAANENLLLAELRQLSLDNNDRAITLLYQHYFQRLYHFALSLVKVKMLAEEVVEDVFIKIWSRPQAFVQMQNLSVYLFTAVRNQSLNCLQKEERHTTWSLVQEQGEQQVEQSISPVDYLVLSEMLQSLNVVVESLPERCRCIFRLVREEGFKYSEVAEILNISVNTVNNQMAIAVSRICAALQIQRPVVSKNVSSQ